MENGAALSFGTLLRSLRQAAGLTQEELAFRAGLSSNAVSVLERGARKRPHPHTVRSLTDGLGLSEEGRAALLAAVPGRGDANPPAAGSIPLPDSTPTLPCPATPLVGRERELEAVGDLLARPEVRLLTLTGTGGVGKTRLATEAAREAEGRFPEGAAFAGLAPLGDHRHVAASIVRALGLREAEGLKPREVLERHLRDKRLLLVLDNFEHVLDAAPEVADLVEACPGLSVLITSRAPLRVRGEREHPVPPLALPASTRSPEVGEVLASPAGMLFAERARAVSPDFKITAENAGAVAAICWRLGGLPLAVELAAAKARYLDPATLLSRLDEALSTGWARDVPGRHRTMRATMAWSEDLLCDKERAVFRRLSVFAGGFFIESAEAVVPGGSVRLEDVLGLLGELIEQSLVMAEPGAGGRRRYKMLEPVRQYAREKLEEIGEADATRERHAEHFLTLAETARHVLLGSEYPVWSGRLDQEHDNLREALRRALDVGDICAGLRLVGALSWFWWMQGYLEEGRRWAEAFLSQTFDEDSSRCSLARAGALYAAGELAFGQGDLARAAGHFEDALALYRGFGYDLGVAAVLAELGQVVRSRGDHDRAAALSEESLDLGRSLDDSRIAAIALGTLGRVERHRGNPESAVARYEESLDLFRELGHRWGIAYTLANLAVAALERGDVEQALALNEEGLSIYRELGDESGAALVSINLGDVARERDDEEQALELYNHALTLYRNLGNERGAARALNRLSGLTVEGARQTVAESD